MTTTVLRSTGAPSIDVHRHGNGAAMSAYCERRKDSSGPISGQFDTAVWQHAEDQETGYGQEPVQPISTKIRQKQRKQPSITDLFNAEKFYCNMFRLIYKESSQADKVLKKRAVLLAS